MLLCVTMASAGLKGTFSYSIVYNKFQPCGGNKKLFRMKAHAFLVSWSKFGGELMQVMTSQKSASLTSFNLLKLLLDEYIMVAIESQIYEQANQDLMTEIHQLTSPQGKLFLGASRSFSLHCIILVTTANLLSFWYLK